MKKLKQLITGAAILICVLAACGKASPPYELVVCGSYAVPGMFCYELIGGTYKVTVLETDAYGRVFYEYTTKNIISEQQETFYVICQSVDGDYVYFYEDLCFHQNDAETAEVECLKAQNDWGMPLNQDKMSVRKIIIPYSGNSIYTDTQLDVGRLKAACIEALQLEPEQYILPSILDVDGNGHELYLLNVEQNGEAKEYFLLANSDYAVSFLEIIDDTVDHAALRAFKQQKGWGY